MGIGVGEAPGQAHRIHQLKHLTLCLRFAPAQAEGADGIGDELEHCIPGIEGGKGILEDDLHLFLQLPPGVAFGKGDILPLEEDLAVGGGGEAQDRPPQGGLAAARLAHNA